MMEPKRWQRVEELYHAALEREESEQAAFLEQASHRSSQVAWRLPMIGPG
jgi:hypothetical protein